MWNTPEFWVMVSFFGFLALVGKKAYAQITTMLDERSNKIAAEVDNAHKLLDQAQVLLADYQLKHEEAMNQSVEIITRSEKEAMELEKASERDLRHQMELREEFCLARIQQAEKEMKDYLQGQLLHDAIVVVEDVLRSDPKKTEKLTGEAVKELEKLDLTFNK